MGNVSLCYRPDVSKSPQLVDTVPRPMQPGAAFTSTSNPGRFAFCYWSQYVHTYERNRHKYDSAYGIGGVKSAGTYVGISEHTNDTGLVAEALFQTASALVNVGGRKLCVGAP